MSKLLPALAVAILIAVAGVAGYVFVAHGTLPFMSAPQGSANPGTLDMYVKDSAANWTYVNVTFSLVQVHEANATDSDGWFNLTPSGTGPVTVNLAALKNVSALLGTATLKPGMYTQLRIVVTKATGVMEDGTKVNFTVPSGDLKTTDPFNITSGQTTSQTIDIDLSRSIVEAAGVWYFTPILGSIQTS